MNPLASFQTAQPTQPTAGSRPALNSFLTPKNTQQSFNQSQTALAHSQSYLQRVQDTMKAGADISGNAQVSGANELTQSTGSAMDQMQGKGLPEKVLIGLQGAGNWAGTIAKTTLGMGIGAAKAGLAPISQIQTSQGDTLGSHFATGAKNLETGAVENFKNAFPDVVNWWNSLHPSEQQGISNVINTVGLTGVGKLSTATAPGVAESLAGVATKSGEGVLNTISKVQDIGQSVGNKLSGVNKAPDARIVKVADEWKAPTVPGKVSNPASFSKATAVLEYSPDTPNFLAEQGIHPANNIENGRYATADTADALRATAGQMSKDTLRPSLQQADYITPKTPVADLMSGALSNLSKDKNITEGDLATITKNIQKETALLQKKYPHGMSLAEMDDAKITYAKNGGYSPVKSALDNNTATANRALSSSLADMVQTKAPADLPVGDFKTYLSQYYKAADYLDQLNNKKAPVSLTQYLARRGSQVAGAVVGHGIGGGILGGVGGYLIGGAIEHAIENLTGPMRATFMKNLQITNPVAYTKVQEYLKNMTSGGTGVPRLNPPSAIQLPEAANAATKPVVGSGESTVKSVPAAQGLPNEKTGAPTFKSTPNVGERGFINYGAMGEDLSKMAKAFMKNQPSSATLRALTVFLDHYDSKVLPQGETSSASFTSAVRKVLKEETGLDTFDWTDNKLAKFGTLIEDKIKALDKKYVKPSVPK